MASKKQTSGDAASSRSATPGAGPGAEPRTGKAHEPQWADGLRKLYDSVVDEPLPDNFKDLLAKLDDAPEMGEE